MKPGYEGNYFADELYQYYLEHGKTLPEEILDTLKKSPLELSDKEKEIYVKFILPRRQQIKNGLRTRFTHSGATKGVWHTHLLSCSRSIIGQMVLEILMEEEYPSVEKISSGRTPAFVTPAPPPSSEPSSPSYVKITPVQPEKEISTIMHIPPDLPSCKFPEVAQFKTPDELNRIKSIKRTAILIASGMAIGVIVIMTIIGLVAGFGGPVGEDTAYIAGEVALPLEITSPSPNQAFKTLKITVSGKTGPFVDITIIVENSGENVSCRSDSQGYFSADITLSEGENAIEVVARRDGEDETRMISCQYVMDFATYKSLCRDIDFELLNQNPDIYKGCKYFVSGSIKEILESEGSTIILLDVTRGRYGTWYDTICVSYQEALSAQIGSIITLYGEIQGSYSTFSARGKTVTYPLVNARFIELNR